MACARRLCSMLLVDRVSDFSQTPRYLLTASNTTMLSDRSKTRRSSDSKQPLDINVLDYGAVADFKILGHYEYFMDPGRAVLSASGFAFQPAMIGKTIVIPAGGPGGKNGPGFIARVIAVGGNTNGHGDYTQANLDVAPPSRVDVQFGHGGLPEVGTDNTSAFNAAIAAARSMRIIGGHFVYVFGTMIVPDGTYIVTSINLTSTARMDAVGYSSLQILGHGIIWGVAAGRPVIDALGSRYINWDGVSIYGDTYSIPDVGLQIGRIASTGVNSADNNQYRHLSTYGSFSLASVLNEQSETTLFDKVHLYNGAENGFALIFDGYHHFDASSIYVDDKEPINRCESFDENLITNSILSAATPLWVGCTSRLRIISSYAVNTNLGSPYGVVLYNEVSGNGNIEPDFDLHVEGPSGNMTSVFAIEGDAKTVRIEGFRWREHGSQATESIFKIDPTSATTSVSMSRTSIDLFSGPHLFDKGVLYKVSGTIYVKDASDLNTPNFAGLAYTEQGLSLFLPHGRPASSFSTCSSGEVLHDSSYLYICTAANLWKRSALGEF